APHVVLHSSDRVECLPIARTPVTAPSTRPAPPTPNAMKGAIFRAFEGCAVPTSDDETAFAVAPGVVAGTAAGAAGAVKSCSSIIGSSIEPPSVTVNFSSPGLKPAAEARTTCDP